MVKKAARISTLTSRALNKNSRQGFTLVELLIVLIIAGLGFMTVAPRFAENTIMADRSETFFEKIIDSHLKEAQELNTQVFITLYRGSSNVVLSDGERESIPAGLLKEAYINDESPSGTEIQIYFYPDGIFDQFVLTFSDGTELEAYPALRKVVRK